MLRVTACPLFWCELGFIWLGSGHCMSACLRRQTADDIHSIVSGLELLPKLADAWSRGSVPTTMPPEYLKHEVVVGDLASVGRFCSPLPTRTNASTLRLFGPGLAGFADWQVRSAPCCGAEVMPQDIPIPCTSLGGQGA